MGGTGAKFRSRRCWGVPRDCGRKENRVLVQNLDSLCGFHMVIIFGNPISLIADNV